MRPRCASARACGGRGHPGGIIPCCTAGSVLGWREVVDDLVMLRHCRTDLGCFCRRPDAFRRRTAVVTVGQTMERQSPWEKLLLVHVGFVGSTQPAVRRQDGQGVAKAIHRERFAWSQGRCQNSAKGSTEMGNLWEDRQNPGSNASRIRFRNPCVTDRWEIAPAKELAGPKKPTSPLLPG